MIREAVAVAQWHARLSMTRNRYPITATRTYKSGSVRDWISGQTVRLESYQEPGAKFASPGRSMFDDLQWMPKARRVDVLRTLTEAEQWAINNPDDAEKQDQWLREHEDELREQWIAEQEQKREQWIAEHEDELYEQWIAEQEQKGTES